VATPTEAASVGGVGALALAYLKKNLDFKKLHEVCIKTLEVTSMVFVILIGASVFSIVFRGLEGDELIQNMLMNVSTDVTWSFLIVMLFIFILGFFLDFFEITFVVVPLVGPSLIQMGLDPIWLGVMIAMNLQTSFLTPPFGFSLFYLRGVAPTTIATTDIYKGVLPFILIQIFTMALIWAFPGLVIWLPAQF
jgi:tripartite ATP-independent transporter DctM subunit